MIGALVDYFSQAQGWLFEAIEPLAKLPEQLVAHTTNRRAGHFL
jgi:hypothetical protein